MPRGRRGAVAPFRWRRDEHEDRHHVRQRLEELRGDRDAARLEDQRQRREPAEDVGADEAEVGPPEREDHERDRDPAGACGEAVDPLRGERETEARAADSRQRAPRDGVEVAVPRDVDPHRVGRGGRLADRPDVEAGPRPPEVEGNGRHGEPGRVDEPRLLEDDGPEDRQVAEAQHIQRLEREPRRVVGELEVVADVRREPRGAGEDRQREPGDDLVRPQRDHEEREDQRAPSAGDGRRCHRDRQRHARRAADVLDAEKADHRAHQHHPLDAEVEHAGSLREQLAERGEEERCPVRDRGREDDDDDAVVHVVASAARTEPDRSITTR